MIYICIYMFDYCYYILYILIICIIYYVCMYIMFVYLSFGYDVYFADACEGCACGCVYHGSFLGLLCLLSGSPKHPAKSDRSVKPPRKGSFCVVLVLFKPSNDQNLLKQLGFGARHVGAEESGSRRTSPSRSVSVSITRSDHNIKTSSSWHCIRSFLSHWRIPRPRKAAKRVKKTAPAGADAKKVG